MVANLVSKRDPKIARNLRISWENWDFPSPKLQFSSHKIRFSSTAAPISEKSEKIFFNGFLISSTAICFLQRISDFPQWLSTFREIREILSMAASIRKIAIRASYFSQNRDIPR
jgi:hypothetical protein